MTSKIQTIKQKRLPWVKDCETGWTDNRLVGIKGRRCPSTCSRCFSSRWIEPSDLTFCSLLKHSGLPGREIFLTVEFPFRRSLLTSQRQYRSVPERRGSSRSAEVYTGITFRWSVSRRTGARHRADGCVVWTAQKTGEQTVTDRWASHGCAAARVAVRWKAAAEDSGLASWQRRSPTSANNNVCLIRSGPRGWPVVPERRELVKRCWSRL